MVKANQPSIKMATYLVVVIPFEAPWRNIDEDKDILHCNKRDEKKYDMLPFCAFSCLS